MAEEREREILLEVKDLEVTYGSGRKAYRAVNCANFNIYKGETFGLVGESGSGKTTIGRAIIRIHPTAGGKILFDGKQINGRISKALDREVTQRIQMIFQDPMSSYHRYKYTAQLFVNHNLFHREVVELHKLFVC